MSMLLRRSRSRRTQHGSPTSSQLASDAYELIADLIRCVLTKPLERCPERETVALKLLCRLLNDLHCARMLALSGYPAQACALAASAFEAAFVASDVVHSEENARRWVEHSETIVSYSGVRPLVRGVLARLGEYASAPQRVIKEATDIAFHIYSQLCMAKHINPVLERNLGRDQGRRFLVFNGPDMSDDAIRASKFGLAYAVRYGVIPVRLVVSFGLGRDECRDLPERAVGLHERCKPFDAMLAHWPLPPTDAGRRGRRE